MPNQKCSVCNGSGLLLLGVCPLCDGVLGWPEQDHGRIMSFNPDTIPTIPRGPMPAESLTVLSWNIFNPDTVGVQDKSNPHYIHLTDEERFWENRFPKIVEEIRIANAAVVCIQEINKDLYLNMHQALGNLGYEGVTHCEHPYPPKKMERNSLAIFFKHNLSKAWEKKVKVKGFQKTLAVGLRDGDRILAIVTCHLEGAPQKSAERLEQLAKTVSAIADQKTYPHDAIVIAGDFNAPLAEDRQHSAVSSYLSSGVVPEGTMEMGYCVSSQPDLTPHGYSLSSAYAPGAAMSISLHGEGPAFIDQIWFSGSLQLVGARDVCFDEAFRTDVLARGLPNLRNPSDHLPLGAAFHWK